MEEATTASAQVAGALKHIGRRLLTIGENRVELLRVEVQEERERLLRAILMAFGMVACALLASITLTAAIVILLWAYSPAAVLVVLTIIYAAAAALLGAKLMALLRDWQTLPATLDQLRKDRACLEKTLT